MNSLIITQNLHKSFFTPAGEIKVLKGIDVEFKKGEIVSIIGLSGAGKSTFLHVLGTLDRPTEGLIQYQLEQEKTINPFSLNSVELSRFRNEMIGFIFQFHYLLPEFSALENVVMAGLINAQYNKSISKNEIYDKGCQLLSDLGIYNRKDHKPGELSGGEQQRVAVARALLLNPAVVFADEPTGNLDSSTGDELFRLLIRINNTKGTTFVIVTHNEYLSKRCNRVLEMIDGRLNAV
ncbi:MAG: ABC transporter ATP-binding protein [Thermodesulfovibrionales bacterium]|nr:ABC transporter ATP-binding protein [Thermodesulfovibrionales bacterium]